MKVLFLFESKLRFIPGELAVIAAQTQVSEVIVLAPAGPRLPKTGKLKFYSFPWPDGNLAYYFSPLALLLYGFRLGLHHRPDLFQAESPHLSGFSALILSRLFKARLLIEYRVDYLSVIRRRYPPLKARWLQALFLGVSRLVVNKASAVGANSPAAAAAVRHLYHPRYLDWYHPGLDTPPKIVLPQRRSARVFGYLGRFEPDKGPLVFLKAIVILKTVAVTHGLKFLMAGEGSQKPELNRFIRQHQLASLVILKSFTPRWEFLSQIDVLINPTLVNAALEMVNAEAASLGIPSLCSGNGRLPQTVKNGVTGIHLPPNRPELLAKAIINLHHQPRQYQAFSRAAVIHSRRYRRSIQVRRLGSIYRAIG